MERVEVQAKSRTVNGKQVRQLRSQEWIPAVVYGPDTPAMAIQAPERPLVKALRQAGETSLINLFVDDGQAPLAVLTHEVQRNAITGKLMHVDFYQVRLTEKVKISPHLRFLGEPQASKSGLAVLLHNMNEVEVECLPTDLIHFIEVDVSGLINVGDSVCVRDLVVPPGVTILAEPDEAVATLVPTRTAKMEEEEEAAAAAKAEAAPEEAEEEGEEEE
jgi:large subunit ribosomal protein L25